MSLNLNFLKVKNSNRKSIIYISSNVVKSGSYNYPAYASSKSSMNNLILSLAKIFSNCKFYILNIGPTNTSKYRFNHNITSKKISYDILQPENIANKIYQILRKKYDSPTIFNLNK